MRLLIIEDEPLIARRLEQFARQILGDRVNAVRTAADFESAREQLATSAFDLVLLDLNLEGADGLGLLTASVAGSFHTVVVSAYTEQAIRCFEFGVLDFVPKPFTRERLAKALERAVATGGARHSPAANCLAVRKLGRLEIVPIGDILYLEGADKYTELVLRDGRRELHDKLLSGLESILPEVFERIHKSYIVRWDEVVRLHSAEGGHHEAELRNGLRLPVGRARYADLKVRLEGDSIQEDSSRR